jgi:serine O-acetyltransferase
LTGIIVRKETEMIIPGKKAVERTIKNLFKLLFPVENNLVVPEEIDKDNFIFQQVSGLLQGLVPDNENVARRFMNELLPVREKLLKDAEFILESDPAATELIEVVSVYPGFFAIFSYRLAHILSLLSVKLLPRVITEYAHKNTGIDIHPGADIGCPFSIDHGTGIVIGETTTIGNNVKMYQGVTLGALSVDKSKASSKRHPTIGNNVILYAGCTILGGETVIGKNSIIGGNVWLTESVPAFSLVYHKIEVVVKDQKSISDQINYVI